jgi:DNA-directed RNA polymerase subunit E'/Rpb7
MESTAFFEKKISLSPSDFNLLKKSTIEDILLKKAVQQTENKCSEHGFVLSGSIKLISRSMGYFESARFTGDANYYVKLEAKVVYPIDGVRVTGQVIRKNKMGLYVNYNDAIRIQIPRDLHLEDIDYDRVEIGDEIIVEIKRSKFAINDPYILASGLFINNTEERNNNSNVSSESNISSNSNISELSLSESNSSSSESNSSSSESNSSSTKSNASSNASSLGLSNVSSVYNSSSSESNSNEELELVNNSDSNSGSESNVSSLGSVGKEEEEEEEEEENE